MSQLLTSPGRSPHNGIDWNNSLAKGLGLVLSGETGLVNLVTKKVLEGSAEYTGTKFGRAFKGDVARATITTDHVYPWGACTVLVIGESRVSGVSGIDWLWFAGDTVGHNYDNVNNQIDFCGGKGNIWVGSGAHFAWAVTSPGGYQTCYQYSLEALSLASIGTPGTANMVSDTTRLVGCRDNLNLILVWDRQLSQAELFELSKDYSVLFRKVGKFPWKNFDLRAEIPVHTPLVTPFALKRANVQQPPALTHIDNNTLSKGLIFSMRGGKDNIGKSGGTPATLYNSVSPYPGGLGVLSQNVFGQVRSRSYPLKQGVDLSRGDLTFGFDVYRMADTATNYPIIVSLMAGASAYVQLVVVDDNTAAPATACIRVGSSSNQRSDFGGVGLKYSLSRYCVVMPAISGASGSGVAFKMYRDGELLSSTYTENTSTYAGGVTDAVRIGVVGNGGYQITGITDIWTRQLSDAEIKAWCANPNVVYQERLALFSSVSPAIIPVNYNVFSFQRPRAPLTKKQPLSALPVPSNALMPACLRDAFILNPRYSLTQSANPSNKRELTPIGILTSEVIDGEVNLITTSTPSEVDATLGTLSDEDVGDFCVVWSGYWLGSTEQVIFADALGDNYISFGSGGEVYVSINGNLFGGIDVVQVNKRATVVVTAVGGYSSVYLDGKPQVINALSGSSPWDSSYIYVFRGTFASALPGRCNFFMFGKGISLDLARQLSVNPWMFYNTAATRLWMSVSDAQFLRPIGDIEVGTWLPIVGPTLYGELDEGAPNNTDYIVTNNPSDLCKMALAPGVNPGVATGHKLRYTILPGIGTVTVSLVSDGDPVASWTHTSTGAVQQIEQTLTELEVANITDYALMTVTVDTFPV